MTRPTVFQITGGVLAVLVAVDLVTHSVPWWVYPSLLGTYGVGGLLYSIALDSRTSAGDSSD